jgi:HEAT repeat protein
VHDKDPDVRQQALQVLAHSDDPSATTTLSAALQDENADVRTQACSALGERRAANAVDPLIQLLKTDPDSDVRSQAA